MGEDQSQTGRRRFTVAEASEVLGISVEAVRGRIKRDKLEHEREAGTVYVFLGADQLQTGRQPDADQARPDALADELRSRIRYLEGQVEEEREARRRADTLLAQLMQRIPELEAPSEERESPVTDSEASEGAAHGPMPLDRRSPQGGRGGEGCSARDLVNIDFRESLFRDCLETPTRGPNVSP